MLKVFKAGGEVCMTFTLLDGLVMARSAFHHSANYRSAVIFGKPTLVEDRQQKLAALEVFMDNIAPGRWDTLRETNDQEIEATDVLSLPMDEASVKIRGGDPIDDEGAEHHAQDDVETFRIREEADKPGREQEGRDKKDTVDPEQQIEHGAG